MSSEHGKHPTTWSSFYTKTDALTFGIPSTCPIRTDYLEAEYRHVAPDGRLYKETDVDRRQAREETPNTEWRVKRPTHD